MSYFIANMSAGVQGRGVEEQWVWKRDANLDLFGDCAHMWVWKHDVVATIEKLTHPTPWAWNFSDLSFLTNFILHCDLQGLYKQILIPNSISHSF